MIQHQFWVTKKTVQKKLGSKEDECIVSSDAELDAKLELFRSINETCISLQRILDQYQERLFNLSQEEGLLGTFLRNKGKSDDAVGKHLMAAGKAIGFASQQRLVMRGPLMRLYHEVETFRCRAVSDMRSTVSDMEKARTEYRAALSWMKSTSTQLDPDTGKGLDNFRKAQRQVRESKKVFDKLKLDVLQKIDLLAAARCNMFSHALVGYQSAFHDSTFKIADTMISTAESMQSLPQYEFCVLKELCQKDDEVDSAAEVKESESLDKDQLLFFKDEFKDAFPKEESNEEFVETNDSNINSSENIDANVLLNQPTDMTLLDMGYSNSTALSSDLMGLTFDNKDQTLHNVQMSSHFLELSQEQLLTPQMTTENNAVTKPMRVSKSDSRADWFKIFAELDPLGNPDALFGSSNNQGQQA